MKLGARTFRDIDIADGASIEDAPATVDAWLEVFSRFLRLPGAQKDAIREEMRSHLTDRVRDLMLGGAERDHAMRQAVSELGEAAELAEQFRHANRYPRRRLMMHGALIGLGAAAVVAVAAVFSTNNNGHSMEAAVFDASELRADQIDTLKSITLKVTEDMSPRQIIASIAETERIGVSINWGSLVEIGVTADDPMGFSSSKASVYNILVELSQRYGDAWDGIDWRLNDRMLTIDRRMVFDVRERVLASYDVDPILELMLDRYGMEYGGANEQIAEVIRELIEPSQWESNGGAVSQLRIVSGRMFVNAPMRTQEKVMWMLGELAKTGAVDAENHAMPGIPEPSVMPMPTPEQRAQLERDQVAMSRLRNIHMGWQIWAQANEGQQLANLQQLVTGGMLQMKDITSPHGPAKDGQDYWVDFAGLNPNVPNWARRIIGVDRAMYESGDNIATLFADGHIELVPVARFHALLEDAVNEGVKPDLPQRHQAENNRSADQHMFAHTDAAELGRLLIEALGDDVEVVVDPRTNSLVITGKEMRLTRLDPLLDRLNTPAASD